MDGKEVLYMLAEHEKVIGDFYRALSRCFPDQRQFWESISNEEYVHRDEVLSLLKPLESGTIRFTGRFNETAITTSLNFIKERTAAAKAGTIQQMEAFSTAASIEASLLEKMGFEAFAGDADELHRVKDRLLRETRLHHTMIVTERERVKK
jgi:rubrerythrin